MRWRRRRRWIYENVTYYRLVGLRRRCLYIYSRGLRDGVFVVHHTHSHTHTQWWWWRKATHTHTHKNPELDFRLRDFFGARQPESHLPPQSCMARCAVAKCGRRRPLARLLLPPKSFQIQKQKARRAEWSGIVARARQPSSRFKKYFFKKYEDVERERGYKYIPAAGYK